jgi:8-oxo-dGTP pyrophosphatase MutT (NUDIX family)
MDALLRLPDRLAAHALEYLAGGREPVSVRDASTVVLLRERDSLEVYLLRRHAAMEFAGGFYVFPGGGVDERDYEDDVPWAGPGPAEWARLMGVGEGLARALLCAAVRETFEESGVMLAGADSGSVVADTTSQDWERDRLRLESRDVSLSALLRERGLILRSDLLGAWGSWVTPAFEPKRFHARFFVASLPEGQVTRDVSTESDEVTWVSVRDAVRAVDAREMHMLPPTYATCVELFGFDTAEDALAAAADHDQTPVEPVPVRDGDGVMLSLPPRLTELRSSIERKPGP